MDVIDEGSWTLGGPVFKEIASRLAAIRGEEPDQSTGLAFYQADVAAAYIGNWI